ncbi:MAG: tetratricopeptide repeat protein, partial [Candidatus Susulua stagnicola]|nr:tetratricopeptide repeat protein [Candidatus Susulua stagnicola]
FFLSLSIIAVAIFTFFKYRRNFKPVSFGIIWFFVTYAPYSNVIPVCNIISERYLYLPSVGFSIVLAALFLKGWEVIKRNKRFRLSLRAIAIIAITLFLGSYSALTIKRNYGYSNIITYWEGNINNFEDGYRVYNNLAGTYYKMGNLDNAIAYSWINLTINPNQSHVWYNLGRVYQEKGNIDQAKVCFQEVLKIDKDYFPAYQALEQLKIK